MADDANANVPAQGGGPSFREVASAVKPATSWVLPLVTAAVLASAFCLYYFVYVAAQREYLINRNFRSLAVLGDQIQTLVSIHGSILEFSADLAKRKNKEDLQQFVVVRPEDQLKNRDERDREALKDYVKYLAPTFELTTQDPPQKPGSRLDVRRHNGHWELALTAYRHQGSQKDYDGSLELSGVLKPLVGTLPFDDILLVSENGTIVYQSNKAGPQFTTLTSILQAQADGEQTKPSGSAGPTKPVGSAADALSGAAPGHDGQQIGGHAAIHQNADQSWRTRSLHLTDVVLAGTRYKLFLQPVLIDVFSDEPGQDEPAQEWVLCGLRSAKTLEWEALSISSTFMVSLTALFLVIFMGGPVLKVFLVNRREHLRLRELGVLGIFLVLLTSVFTLSGLNAVGFPLNDDTEEQLQRLGGNLSKNVHDELWKMREQLQEWCGEPENQNDLTSDLKLVQKKGREIVRSYSHNPGVGQPPAANIYPYLHSAFWTDDDGQQIIKWSTSNYLAPMIDVSQSRLYTSPKSTYLDGKGPAFHFDSIMPPNELEYLAALTMTTGDCDRNLLASDIRPDLTGGSASLTAQPLSLVDPILPSGYGFALLDETGLVLFHADKTKNTHENVLQESEWSKQLYAATFGHSTQRSLTIKYLGKDHQVRVMPVPGVSQAQWSLVVYRDLASVRTLNLQSMTMTSMLLLAILAIPAIAIAIWSAIRRPQFAPEWLWPNQARLGTYLYQVVVYTLLIILFLFLGFTGSSEQNVVACAAVPYTAFLLTAVCIRTYAPGRQKASVRREIFTLAMIAIPGSIAILLIWPRAHLRAFTYLLVFGIIAVLPLLHQPRRHLANQWKRSFPGNSAAERISSSMKGPSSVWRNCYILSIVLLLLLVGVLIPMALFRASLNVERRLGIKQAQLHLASALDRRMLLIREQCKSGELGSEACTELEKESVAWSQNECASSAWRTKEFNGPEETAWSQIVLDPRFLKDGRLPVCPYSPPEQREELYSGWFQTLVYALHLDYNQTAAEMLGTISDRIDSKSDSAPEWSWDNEASAMTLRWHGAHLIAPKSDKASAPEGHNAVENDLLITSKIPASSVLHASAGVTVATGVILAVGLIVWALARRIFLFHVTPLKMTGALRVAESIRAGRSVLILQPPISDWHLDAQKQTQDLRNMATGPKWAEEFDLDTLKVNTVIEIEHFEHGLNDPELNNQKSILIRRLLERPNTQLAAIMTVAASPGDYSSMFPGLELIDLREEPFYWRKQYEGPAQDPIYKECGPMPALWPLGAQLAKDIRQENIYSEETITSEVLERADGYYRLVWKECSEDQKFVLAQLAEDGLLNPTNGRAIRQLVRKGLITTDPQFRLMNESFRRFVPSATTTALKQEWLRESRRSGWGKVHGAFFTTMILLGAFLLTTQNALWQSSAAYVTTALGALGTLAKLFNTYRGGGTTDKPG
jgi:hypothetical protein